IHSSTMKAVILFTMTILVLMSAARSQDDKPCYPCDPLWPRDYYYPDLDDCSIAWRCRNGELSRFTCPILGQVVDFVAQVKLLTTKLKV
ncbi:hypothetical protein PoB_007245400, partial [Plakobranchus ocellatus]